MLNESRNQQKRIAELEGTVERLATMVKEQAAQIQKVSAQLEMNKPAPHMVANKPLKLRCKAAFCAGHPDRRSGKASPCGESVTFFSSIARPRHLTGLETSENFA